MSSSKPASRRSDSTSQGEASSTQPARRSQQSRASSRTSEKYPLFEVDWWRVGAYVAGAGVLGVLYLFGFGTLQLLATSPAMFDDPVAILIALGGIGSVLGILWCLVRRPRVLMYEAVTVIVLLLTATRFLPAYTSIGEGTLIVAAALYLPLVAGGGIGVIYRRYRARRPTDRSRREHRRRH